MAGNPNPNDLDIHDMWMVALGVDRTVLALHGNGQARAADPADQSAGSTFSRIIVREAVATAMQQSKTATPADPAKSAGTNPGRHLIDAGPARRFPIASSNTPINKLRSALTALENVKQVGGMYEMIVGGDTVRLTEADYKGAVAKTRVAIHDSLARLRTKVEHATEGLEKQSQIDHDNISDRAVSGVVGAVGSAKKVATAMAETVKRGQKRQDGDNYQEDIGELARDALETIDSSQRQLDQGHFFIAGELLGVAETRAKSVEKMYNQSHNQLMANGETAVKGLEYTETAAAVTLAITATVVTAGGAAGVELGAASTANTIALAMPMTAELAQAGAQYAYGQKVDLLKLGVDLVVTVIVAKFSPQLSKYVTARLLGSNPAARSLGAKAVAGIVGGLVAGRGSAAFGAAANGVYQKYRNSKDVTWGTLVEQTGAAIFDPKSAGLDLILSAIGAAGVSRGTSPLEGPTPARSGGQSPPPEDLTFPRGTDVTNASAFPPPKMPVPVSEVELVASNARNPASIKPQGPQAHQQNWQALGGTGTAPPAYRDPEGNVHVSTDSPLLRPATRGGISPIRTGPSGSSAQKEVKPAPVAASTSSHQEVGTADTGKAPAAPAPDPLAKTPPAPAPPAAAPASPGVPPHERTAQAGTSSQRAVAQTGGRQFAPPQAISEEAVQRLQNQPRPSPPGRKGRGSGVNYTTDHDAHETAWKRLGGHNDAPPAFIYDDQVYLDPSRWPPKR